MDLVQAPQPVPGGRRLLARLCLSAFFGGLLLLLSARPVEAAERREPGLLDPVSTTLKATAREVERARRATRSRASTAGKVADAARPAAPAVKRGAPVVTSPVGRPLALLSPGRLSRLATSGDVLHVLELATKESLE